MNLDLAILTTAFISFFVFFCLQVIIFRRVGQEAVLRWIMNIFWMTSLIHIIGLALLFGQCNPGFAGGYLIMAVVSYFLFGIMAFVYILCVFGPSETSIRIRVVRELFEMKGGRLTHNELLKRYNGHTILRRRLDRLMLAGEISDTNGKYSTNNKSNAFFMIDAVAGFLQKILRKP